MISSQLTIMRTLISEGVRPYFAADKAGVGSRALAILEQVFTPYTAAAHAAVERWTKTKKDTDAVLALRLNQVPGANRQLWETIEAMPVPLLLKHLDRAILKAK